MTGRSARRRWAAWVACSGGPDSLALLSAAVFEGHRLGYRVIGVTVDHGLQDDSAAHATRVVEQMAAMGADGVTRQVTTVDGSETNAGRVAAVLGLVRSWATHGGAFGASGSDGPVPLG